MKLLSLLCPNHCLLISHFKLEWIAAFAEKLLRKENHFHKQEKEAPLFAEAFYPATALLRPLTQQFQTIRPENEHRDWTQTDAPRQNNRNNNYAN